MSKKENFDPYRFSKIIYDGVDVYYKNLPWSPCIHINIVFKNGAFHDPKGLEGLSHFLEHMIFNGSPKLPNKKIIKEWSKINTLNSWNAWTGYHQTNYHLRCLPEKFTEVLDGMKDMIFYPLLRDEDVEHERKVITQEAWGVYKNEKLKSYLKDTYKMLYLGHRHQDVVSPLGWPETVEKITKNDLLKWHSEKYAIGNFYIVIAGNIKKSDLNKVRNFLRGIKKVKTLKEKTEKINKPKLNRIIKNADEIGEVKEQVEISISRSMEPIPLKLRWIDSAFKRLTYDLLIERLRLENSLCYGVSVNTSNYIDFSEININVKTKEENIKIVEKIVWQTIKELINDKHKERYEVIKYLGIDQIKSEEITSEEVENAGVYSSYKYNGKIETRSEILQNMKKVSSKDIAKYVKKVFDKKYVFTEIILPSKK